MALWDTLFSFMLCILGWPEAQFGAYIDIALLAFIYFAARLGWLP